MALIRRLGFGTTTIRPENHRHVATFTLGGRFDTALAFESLDNAFKNRLTKFRVRNLTTTEHHGDFYFVTFRQELLHETGLGIKVTGANLGSILHFLDSHVHALAA